MSNSPDPSTLKKIRLSIADLLDKVQTQTIRSNPTLNDYLNGEAADYFEVITEALGIIQEYRTGERIFDIGQAEQDCLQLAAMHSYVAQMVGYLQGTAARSESGRKMAKSNYAITIKRQRDNAERSGSIVKLTETEIDHAARVLADSHYLDARDMEVISRMITTSWYAIGDFIDVLNASCNRNFREK